ncbi:MAG: FkbM family methyltransferase, partial [Candidatus Bathyarchaeota archaeon]|nr:FkbM family methyltransferase [Candidatus Bathyarchaeota archaeon]
DGHSYVDCKENPLYTKLDSGKNGHKIRTISLDTLLLKNSLLVGKEYNSLVIKIDVEGAELQVVKGASRLIEHLRPTFVIETDKILKVAKSIGRYGYKCRKAFGSYYIIEPALQKYKWISRSLINKKVAQVTLKK